MGRPMKSQWEFCELFPPEQTRKVFTVAELTVQLRRVLEKEFGQIWVSGEVTNLKLQNSGHIYFTLKDASSQLSCVLFRGEPRVDRSLLQDGREVILRGEITVYEPRGHYQLRVTDVELRGLGALQAAFEKLKQKLKAEGLFAPGRKRPLPRYAQRIGVVTSPTGAAIRDVLHVVERRNPGLRMIIAPCRVQGDGAANEIASAIRLLNEFHGRQAEAGEAGQPLDLILVTRGGGSLEDLWAFNEEIVAHAICSSALPVVSAVGHEVDFTISDFVADVRAATPSAAAEIITEGVFASCEFLSSSQVRMRSLVRQLVEQKAESLGYHGQRLQRVHPRRKLNEWLQRVDDLQSSLLRCVRVGLRHQAVAWRNLSERLLRVRPAVALRQRRELARMAADRLREQLRHRVNEKAQRLGSAVARLRLLGPEQVLARGYSITLDERSGAIVRDADQVKAGERLRTRLAKGQIRSIAEGG